jgi:cyclase
MLKIRVMPTLLYKDTTLVKGIGFNSWRRVGSLMQSVKVYNMRQVDELVFLDISATRAGREPDYELVDEFADECFMPLSVGGGIQTIEHVNKLLTVGADKVVVNTAAIVTPELVTDIAESFGSQCVIVSLDYRVEADGRRRVYSHSGTVATDHELLDLACQMEALGAGELIITSIERDGTMRGYDVETIKQISSAVQIPVIASGGAGTYEDMRAVIQDGRASAVAAASIFHFTEQTPFGAKLYLHEHGLPTRL